MRRSSRGAGCTLLFTIASCRKEGGRGVQRAVNDGWDRTLAETRAGFILTGTRRTDGYEKPSRPTVDMNMRCRLGILVSGGCHIEATYDGWKDAAQDVVDGIDDIATAAIASEQAIKDAHAANMADMEAAHEGVAALHRSSGNLPGGGGGGTRADGRSLADFLQTIPATHIARGSWQQYHAGQAEDPNNPGHSATRYTGSDAVYSRHGGPVRAGVPYRRTKRGNLYPWAVRAGGGK